MDEVDTPVLVTPELWVVFFFAPYAAVRTKGKGEITSLQFSIAGSQRRHSKWLLPPHTSGGSIKEEIVFLVFLGTSR